MDYYFNRSLFGWAIKDAFSRYVYANHEACLYFNMPSEKIKGHTDKDLFPDLVDFYETIIKDDKKIINTGAMSIVLKIFNQEGNNRKQAYLVEKRLWQLPDGSPGIICNYIEITNIYFSTFLYQRSRQPLTFTAPSPLFTDREWEVILLLLCGMKKGRMSAMLNLSKLTLRNRIARCCEKANVMNEIALAHYCQHKGWDNYIPPFFLKKGYITFSGKFG
ncbi:PAS domain-containing protein [Erwinia sp. 198]|uniref:PAS domain-containing protein n=1 Tax=Erwinia sp. 198 TaxID=2022746 RepID=UPI000F65F51F|nr:PAS domain-containing protein [Erwinia sp. 198]RRZ89366.1 LuxR family transcriptional regulator [Erwinia sp. 198]